MPLPTTVNAIWTPQIGPQAEAIAATWCTELFYGGAVGGGKSDYLLGDFLQDVNRYQKHWHGVLFRQSYKELEAIIARSYDLFPDSGARWYEGDKVWEWSNGATLKLRHLENIKDTLLYQGHEYTWMGFDEITHWADPGPIRRLMARLRYSQLEIPTKRIRLTGNPGGPGHQWVKDRYIDPAPLGYKPWKHPKTGHWIMYIPSRLEDNQILMKADPEYINRLYDIGSPELVRCWKEGDWNVIAGAFFTELSPVHIIQPRKIPNHWTRFRSLDWGSAKPFSVGWFAVSDGGIAQIPKGAIVQYREWYGASEPNVGIKMLVGDVAEGIKRREDPEEQINYSVADPSIFTEDGGVSHAETFSQHGVHWMPADNSRVPGWEQVRMRLRGEDQTPMIYFFSNCVHIIRTLPALQHDEHKPEDVDTDGEDHAPDMLRYACMSRPYITRQQQTGKLPKHDHITLNQLYEQDDNRGTGQW